MVNLFIALKVAIDCIFLLIMFVDIKNRKKLNQIKYEFEVVALKTHFNNNLFMSLQHKRALNCKP